VVYPILSVTPTSDYPLLILHNPVRCAMQHPDIWHVRPVTPLSSAVYPLPIYTILSAVLSNIRIFVITSLILHYLVVCPICFVTPVSVYPLLIYIILSAVLFNIQIFGLFAQLL
jgi:hypothetical protein